MEEQLKKKANEAARSSETITAVFMYRLENRMCNNLLGVCYCILASFSDVSIYPPLTGQWYKTINGDGGAVKRNSIDRN